MKRYLTLIFFAFSLLFASSSFASSACKSGNGGLDKDEIAACIQQEANAKGWFSLALAVVTKNQIVVAVGLLQSVTGLDFTSEAEKIVEKVDGGTNLIKALDYVINLGAKIFFVIVYCMIVLRGLLSGAYKGFVVSWSVLPFGVVTLIIAVTVATGYFSFFIKVLFVLILIMACAIFYSANIFYYMATDLSGVTTRLNKQAEDFSQATVYSMIEWHVQDLVARKGMLVETGNLENTMYGTRLVDSDFPDCLIKDLKTSSKKSNNKLFQPVEIEKTQYCGAEELGYETYKIGYMIDKKPTNESEPLFLKLVANQSTYRAIASEIVSNTCGSVFNVDKDIQHDYVSMCLDMASNGGLIPDGKGYVKTLQNAKITDFDEMKAKIKVLIDDLSVVTYSEMLRNGNTVEAKVDESVTLENMLGNFQLGSVYKQSYEAAGMKTIDIQVVNEVAIKKSKLQQFFGIEDNLSIFDGEGDKTTFGIDKYFGSLKPTVDMNSEIIALLDGISGNGLTNIGLQDDDCFQKVRCNPGTVNFVEPLFELGHRVIPWVASAYVMAVTVETYYKSKYEAADMSDPNRAYYKANERYFAGFGLMCVGVFAALGIAFVMLAKVLILNYIRLLLVGFFMPFIVPFTFGYALINSTYNRMFKDDGETLTDMMKKYGVVDVMLRLPLVVIGMLLGIIVMIAMMYIASVTLAAMFGGFAQDNAGAGSIQLAVKAIFFVFMYVTAYIISFYAGMSASYHATEKAIKELCSNAAQFDDGVNNTIQKGKSLLSKLSR
ncbi:hypothetical protein ALQ65_01000 [Pseudomonas syringae pv. coriandricola]|uniref:Uncharacterized protein n=1 Tax=Pseudomonas syringae pv. coriandricola TaxID=264453 RepID=A0A3M3JJB7_9PSED|nr:hypothetical protein ALQ65_01000 [Pseudomonas syringae pv. coriandricola]